MKGAVTQVNTVDNTESEFFITRMSFKRLQVSSPKKHLKTDLYLLVKTRYLFIFKVDL